MILRRLGNKKKLMPLLMPHFPEHRTWIEPFFGSGSAFFYKPKAKYNILNDLDSDVFNLFQVVMNQKDELAEAVRLMPIHSDLMAYWNKNKETEPIKKALRFLLLSNFGYMGKPETLVLSGNGNNGKEMILDSLKEVNEMLCDCIFSNRDAVDFINAIAFRELDDRKFAFIYCDPPYLGTTDNYQASFTEQQSGELFECLVKRGCKFALSEFDHPFILEQAKTHNLNIITLGERQNMKNRRVEILVTNYENRQQKLF